MKFFKNLMGFLGALLAMAAIAAVIWFFYGDFIEGQIPALIEVFEDVELDPEENAKAEQMRQVLEQAVTHYGSQTLITCHTYEEQADGNADIPKRTTWDRQTSLVQQVTNLGGYEQTTIQQPYDSTDYLSGTWTCFQLTGTTPEKPGITYSINGDPYDTARMEAEYETWYYYDTLCQFNGIRSGEFDENMPYVLLRTMDMTSYEIVGTEDCDGRQAIHYIVTHAPRMQWEFQPLDAQFHLTEEDGTTRWVSPKEFYETVIDQSIKDGYPEFYEAFMALIDQRFYQDNQTHLWIAEDGELVQIQWDVTYENYYFPFWNGETESILNYLEDAQTGSEGSYSLAFSQFLPVTRTAVFYYGDTADPIVIPTEYEDLTA